ncbi:MAG: ABC transporter permease [Hyphomicrobiales bacterium]|nr:ABC transporter permease [Hyphomicrobiales bacterium]MBV9113948.1 ABC transporter permease [Hyphomicrobiales bacterium]MBV9518736.1 ABC transporter permease [Hyphomicrobiales bacterium]
MTGRKLDDLFQWLGIAMLAIIACFLLVPIIVTVVMAFDARPYLGSLPPPALSTRWFQKFFSDDYFLRGLGTSVELAILAVAISLGVGVATAVALDRLSPRAKEALSTLFLSPLIVPPVVIGFALLLFLSGIGVVSGFARLLCGHIIITVPYTIRATLAGLSGIDSSLTEAALSLGARERDAFWDITFPLARTGIFCGAIFACAISMDDVAVSIMLTDAHTFTLPVALISSMRANFDLTIAAASVLLMLVTLALILVLEKLVGLHRVIGQGVFR